MRAGTDLDGRCVVSRQCDGSRCIGRYHHLYFDLLSLDVPCRFSDPIRSAVPCAGKGQTTTRVRLDGEMAITRLGWSETANGAMQTVSDGAQRVVIEGCHLAWINRAVGAQAIPAFPDRCRSHRHRIEPRGAFAFRQQTKSSIILTNAAQSVTNERCAYKAGADMISTLAHEGGQTLTGMVALLSS